MRRLLSSIGALAFLGLALLPAERASAQGCLTAVLPNDNSTSGNFRGPIARFAFGRAVWLIKPTEMAAASAGFPNGSVPISIGFSNQTAPGLAASAPLKVYLLNTADVTNLRSTNWLTAITGMTQVHDATSTLPNVTGPFEITFSGGSPFTYTGGGLYVAVDWGQYTGTLSTTAVLWCNSAGLVNGNKTGQSNAAAPTTVASTSFRPETFLRASIAPPLVDAAVSGVYTYGSLPLGYFGPQSIKALITNNGAATLTNVAVNLSITGTNAFSDAQVISSLPGCGATQLVTFAAYSPTILGSSTITVTLPASDDNNANNSLAKSQDVTSGLYSYKHPGSVASGGVGVNANTAAFGAKFTLASAADLTQVNLEFFATSATTYKVAIYGDAAGLPSTTPLYIDAANRTVTVAGPVAITLPTPLTLGAGTYYAGIHQTNTTNASLSFDTEAPIRSGAFYLAIPLPVTTWFDESPGNNFKLNVGVTLAPPSCIPPSANIVSVLSDCDLGTYAVTVNLSSIGNAPNVDIVASPSGTFLANDVTALTTYSANFPIGGVAQTITVIHNGNAVCNLNLGSVNGVNLCATNGGCFASPTIPDNGCGSNTNLDIGVAVSGLPTTLGNTAQQAFFQNFQTIVAHTWCDDIRIKLISPTGQSRDMILNRFGSPSISTVNLGDPATCPTSPLTLQDGAPTLPDNVSVNGATGPYAPEQTLLGFTGNPNGTWTVRICDAVGFDTGNIRYLKLNFQTVDCLGVPGGSATPGTGCNDGNACTTGETWDSGCVCQGGTAVNCDDANACTIDTCDPVLGCQYTPVNCDDSNACTIDTCDPVLGCQYAPVNCDDSDACTTDSCDPVLGCQYAPVNCDDSDACTTDTCDPVLGCQYAPVNCDDSDACTTDSCDPVLGCQYAPVNCDDSDACTTDTCDPVLGCQYAPVNCDDSDACTTDSCDPVLGCQYAPVNCDDSDACTTDSCDPVLGCQYAPVNCDDGDACTTDTCDPVLGCQYAPVNCDDSDACTTDTCDPVLGCQYAPVNCDDSDACTTDSCDPVLGCQYAPVNCDDSDACTTDSCDPVLGCQYAPVSCDDSDPCTADSCDPVLGCQNVFQDADGDLICDANDDCPNTPGEQGDPCDDFNPFTIGDVINGSCVCAGTAVPCSEDVVVEFRTDDDGDQTSWEIKDDTSPFVVCSGPMGSYGDNTEYTEPPCCLVPGCYILSFFDSFGDGMCCSTPVGEAGYRLFDENGKRIIDSWRNGTFVSTSSIGQPFCVPLGPDKMTIASCDREDLLPTSVVVASANVAVTAEFGVTNTTSGYGFWIYDPHGTYSRRIFLSHANPGHSIAPGPTEAAHLRLSQIISNPVPQNILLNIRVRGRVAGTYAEFGPACRLKIDAAAAYCPTTQLDNNPLHIGTTYSCGVTGKVVGASGNTGKIWATAAIRNPGAIPANRYQFVLAVPAEGYTRTITVSGYSLVLGPWVATPLLCGTFTYDVKVRASFDGGASYCAYGNTCTVEITNNGGLIPCTAPFQGGGHYNSTVADATTLALWPNPNRGDQLYMQLSDVQEGVTEVTVNVYDLFGKLVLDRVIPVEGAFSTVLQLNSDLAAGLYTVNLTAGSETFNERLVIE